MKELQAHCFEANHASCGRSRNTDDCSCVVYQVSTPLNVTLQPCGFDHKSHQPAVLSLCSSQSRLYFCEPVALFDISLRQRRQHTASCMSTKHDLLKSKIPSQVQCSTRTTKMRQTTRRSHPYGRVLILACIFRTTTPPQRIQISHQPAPISPQYPVEPSSTPSQSSTPAKQGPKEKLAQPLLGRYSKWKSSWRLQTTVIEFFLLGRCNTTVKYWGIGCADEYSIDLCGGALRLLFLP